MTTKRLDFDALRVANICRLPVFKNAKGEFSHTKGDGSDWTPADWFVAVAGELGEAGNILKKIKRGDFTLDEARPKLAKEFADVIIYLDILAFQLNIGLGENVREKFNEVSKRQKLDIFL